MSKENKISKFGRPIKYLKIKNIIIADIVNSKLQPEEFYATEKSLGERFGAGRNTIRKAIAELEQADFIIRRKRLGILAGKRINFLNNNDVTADNYQAMPARIVLILPFWDTNAGGFYCSQVIRDLRSQKNGASRIIDIRHYDDDLEHIGSDVEAIIAVDPRDSTIMSQLRIMSQNNIKIIIVEPSTKNFKFAVSIRPSMAKAINSAVKQFVKLGHKNIGIINASLEHDVYRQFLQGFLAAHHDCQLSIHPNAVIFENEHTTSQIKLDVKNISAWICSNNSCLNLLARACNIHHLNVPEDISVIGIDDPGDAIFHSLGTTLSVIHPDYSIVGSLIQRILHDWDAYTLGDIVELPAVNTSRNSVAPPNQNRLSI